MRDTTRKRKTYEELDFIDDFMFCKILQNNPDLCKELTELIIGKEIGEIITSESQKSIEITADGLQQFMTLRCKPIMTQIFRSASVTIRE